MFYAISCDKLSTGENIRIIFVLFVHNLLYNHKVSPLSAETDTLNTVNSLNLSEHHSETKRDEQSKEITDSV